VSGVQSPASILRKLVYGLGIIGAAMLLGGQALSFALSGAAVSAPAVLSLLA